VHILNYYEGRPNLQSPDGHKHRTAQRLTVGSSCRCCHAGLGGNAGAGGGRPNRSNCEARKAGLEMEIRADCEQTLTHRNEELLPVFTPDPARFQRPALKNHKKSAFRVSG